MNALEVRIEELEQVLSKPLSCEESYPYVIVVDNPQPNRRPEVLVWCGDEFFQPVDVIASSALSAAFWIPSRERGEWLAEVTLLGRQNPRSVLRRELLHRCLDELKSLQRTARANP